MKGRVAAYWRHAGLVDVIAEICLNLEPDRIYGFFAGTPSWSAGGTKYRYFFTAGVESALSSGLKPKRVGCFHGSGMAALTALGRCFYAFAASGFEDAFVDSVKQNGYLHVNTRVWYQEVES